MHIEIQKTWFICCFINTFMYSIHTQNRWHSHKCFHHIFDLIIFCNYRVYRFTLRIVVWHVPTTKPQLSRPTNSFLFLFFQMMLPVTSRVNRVPRRPFWVDPVFPMVWLPPETWSVISAKVQLPLEVHMGTMKSHLSEKSPFPETMKIKPINVILVLSIGLQILP